MNPNLSPDNSNDHRGNDVDLGYLIHRLARLVKRAIIAIGRFFTMIGMILLSTLFFLRKNLVWLILGVAAGIAMGVYREQKDGSKFQGTMTVRANFNSSAALYSASDYLNALINNGNYPELSAIFNIPEPEARSLQSFSITPVQSELIIVDLYRERFLKTFRNDQLRQDTFWTRTVKYADFKKNLTELDFPMQQVTVISTNPGLFAKLQPGFINIISSNEILQKSKAVQRKINAESEAVLSSSLSGLDTLRRVYNDRLTKTSTQSSGGNTINVLEKDLEQKTPELNLYDKVLEINEELSATRQSSVISDEIVQVYSPFFPVGEKVSIFKQNIFRNALSGLLLVLLILVGISLFKYLALIEKKRRGTEGNNTLQQLPPDSI